MRSTRGRSAGNFWRPGCGLALLSVLLLDLFERLALSFGFYFGGTYAGLHIQQLQLCVGQLVALRSVLLDALLAQLSLQATWIFISASARLLSDACNFRRMLPTASSNGAGRCAFNASSKLSWDVDAGAALTMIYNYHNSYRLTSNL